MVTREATTDKCLAFENRISKAFEIMPLNSCECKSKSESPTWSVDHGWPAALSHSSVSHRLDRAHLRLGKLDKEPLAGRFSSDVALRYSTKLESKVGKEVSSVARLS